MCCFPPMQNGVNALASNACQAAGLFKLALETSTKSKDACKDVTCYVEKLKEKSKLLEKQNFWKIKFKQHFAGCGRIGIRVYKPYNFTINNFAKVFLDILEY